MCFGSSSKPAPTPAPAPAAPPAPLATVAPAEGVNRKDASSLAMNRGRNSLRIDRTAPETGSTGSGLNIPG